MLRIVRERLRQGHRTIGFPKAPAAVPARFRGAPSISQGKCLNGCKACADVCPQAAIAAAMEVTLDAGRCVFCGACTAACPHGLIKLEQRIDMGARKREDLICRETIPPVRPLEKMRLDLYRHSFKLRQVSAGGCNACEADINVLGTVVFDLGRFGIQVVASPRHADGIIVTGPVSANMKQALLDTYQATPGPRVVIACGSCAISGGPFRDSPEIHNGLEGLLPVDLYIPGCPPHPLTILDALLKLLGRSPG